MSSFYENKFAEELIDTANRIATPGKGILAADESTGTIGKRFSKISVENNDENRRAYRELLFTSPEFGKYISGVILYEETLFQSCADGTTFVDLLNRQGVVVGIKTDLGTCPLPYTNGETYTQGLTDLHIRSKKYYEAGARFAKWRCTLSIGNELPSDLSIECQATTLAQYASVSQANGLVPIVEPEILMDGTHDIRVCQRVTERVVKKCYEKLELYRVLLEGSLLKPNMVLPGTGCPDRSNSAEIARCTVEALRRSVPASVPGIMFLSGGQSEEEATVNLNAMNVEGLPVRPWRLSFSYGRALQASCLQGWRGDAANIREAQTQFLIRAKANSDAQLGRYSGDAASEYATISNFVQNYSY
jgi:fructose-bisphosphate aldolase class I